MTGTLDTRKFTEFINAQSSLISTYAQLQTRYDGIVDALSKNWKGQGAEAFIQDAKVVKTNIVGLGDILTTMCSTLSDALEIFDECDTSLGHANKEVLDS